MKHSPISIALCFAMISTIGLSTNELDAQSLIQRSKSKVTTESEIKRIINEALDTRIDVDIDEEPLEKLVDVIEKEFGIWVYFDKESLNASGIDPEEAVSLSAKNVTLRAMLKATLRDMQLVSYIRNGGLKITTPEAAAENLITKTYDISYWVQKSAKDEAIVSQWNYPTREKITDSIQDHLSPETWVDMGGTGTISELKIGNKHLILVSSTDEVHDEIAAFLNDLEQHVPKQSRKTSATPEEKGAHVDDDKLVIHVYSLQKNLKSTECVAIIKKVFPEMEWKEGSRFIESAGSTVIVKQKKSAHKKISKLFKELGWTMHNHHGYRGLF